MPHPIMPTPYEYALISEASYYANEADLGTKRRPILEFLRAKGWRFKTPIIDGEYHGSIWINKLQEQVVIAHRGSENGTSWVTDIESVVQRKPGTFVQAAIDTLLHPDVHRYLHKGYRLSTTGHSLGGFLAQVCLYWSKRRDFMAWATSNVHATKIPVASSSSDPAPKPIRLVPIKDMSAMVFDSPGAVNFLENLDPNLRSEEGAIDLRRLRVHNFCAAPTIVSTFGTHMGTIWHLGCAEDLTLPFVNAHRMEYILRAFDPNTGFPKRLRQMVNWPQANYGENFQDLLGTVAFNVIKVPFDFLNALYQRFLKRSSGPTWYTQVTKKHSPVKFMLGQAAATDSADDLESIEKALTLAIHGEYSFLPKEIGQRRLALYHFDAEVQDFLIDIVAARDLNPEKNGWNDILQQTYGDFSAMLHTISIEVNGDRAELVLPDSYKDNIFQFHQELLIALHEKTILNLKQFIVEKISGIPQEVEEVRAELATLAEGSRAQRRLKEDLQALQIQFEHLKAAQKQLEGSGETTVAGAKLPAMLKLLGDNSELTDSTIINVRLTGIRLGRNPTEAQLAAAERAWNSVPAAQRRAELIGAGSKLRNVFMSGAELTLFDIQTEVPIAYQQSDTGITLAGHFGGRGASRSADGAQPGTSSQVIPQDRGHKSGR